jgi:beta-lactamase regulating signal transducer with metallopeptidase domain
MNAIMDAITVWSASALRQAWPMLWQSSLLIGVVQAIDLETRRRLRPAVRYALWLVVLVKLMLPPSLALPIGVGWWVRPGEAPRPMQLRVTYLEGPAPTPVPDRAVSDLTLTLSPPKRPWPLQVLALVGWMGMSLGLLGWMLVRWRQSARDVRRAECASKEMLRLLEEVKRTAGVRGAVRLKLTERLVSPVVYGWFRPVVLLPQALTARLSAPQLRVVLLHELFHIRRADVWVNCVQALLQLVYWWHPLLWLANSRMRRLREEAVDDAVMLALRDEAESYAPTLVEVAKLALRRPLATLGLVGILESRTSLRQRVERLLNFQPPRRAGLSVGAVLSVIAFAALAVPMGQAPAGSGGGDSAINGPALRAPSLPADTNAGAKEIFDPKTLYTRVFKLEPSMFRTRLNLATNVGEPTGLTRARSRQR